MAWQKIHTVVSHDAAALLADSLEAGGALAVTLADAGDEPLYEPLPGTTPLWQATRVEALYDAEFDWERAVSTAAAQCGVSVDAWQRELLADQAWERAWLERFRPMRFGERLWICPSAWPVPEEADTVIRLDPGLAFGTGTHPTTALCLELLDRHGCSGARVIDYGCGSGVLGIGAVLLGAVSVQALDIDPQAITATNDNAQANGVAGQLQATTSPADLSEADLMLANILAGPLVSLAEALANLTRPGGRIVLSGILARQAQEVMAAYAPWFDLEAPIVNEDWVAITGLRHVAP